MDFYFTPASPEHIRRERHAARELRQSLWWRQVVGKGVCYHCQQRFSSVDLTMDHVIPLARGGKSTKKNVVPSCKPCNTAKGYLTAAEVIMQNK